MELFLSIFDTMFDQISKPANLKITYKKPIRTQGPDPQKTIKNPSKIDGSEFSIICSSNLDQNSLHFDSQIHPRAFKNRSRDSPRAYKTPPRHQKPPKDLPRASPDLPKTLPRPISDHFFIKKLVSEPQFSSQESRFRRPAALDMLH